MTLSSDLSGPSVEPRVIRKQYAMEMAVERTRLLYQGSLLPTLFMLINGLVSHVHARLCHDWPDPGRCRHRVGAR